MESNQSLSTLNIKSVARIENGKDTQREPAYGIGVIFLVSDWMQT